MRLFRVLTGLTLAAMLSWAGAAEARVIRSGGSSGTSGACPTAPPAPGPGIGVFPSGGGVPPVDSYNQDAGDAVFALPADACIDGSYEFVVGETLDFTGSVAGDMLALSTSTAVDTQFVWTLTDGAPAASAAAFSAFAAFIAEASVVPPGGFTFTSATIAPSFVMPAELLSITEPLTLYLTLTIIIEAKEGFSFYECYPAPECIRAKTLLGDTLTFMSMFPVIVTILPEPVPAAPAMLLMLTGLAGLAAARKRARRAGSAAP